MKEIDVTELREELGLSKQSFSELLGVHPKTVYNWENGGSVNPIHLRKLRELSVSVGNNKVFALQRNVNGHNITGNNVLISEMDNKELLNIIARRDDALARSLEHLSRLQDELARSQEQISTLLEIIKNMQGMK